MQLLNSSCISLSMPPNRQFCDIILYLRAFNESYRLTEVNPPKYYAKCIFLRFLVTKADHLCQKKGGA